MALACKVLALARPSRGRLLTAARKLRLQTRTRTRAGVSPVSTLAKCELARSKSSPA